MAFLQIKSNNPNLSFALYKNPMSGMILKRYKKGTLFGYFSDDNLTYNIYFKDGDDEVSFKNNEYQEFEYNDTGRYNSPLFLQGAVNEFLKHFTNSDVLNEHDSENLYNNKIIINQMDMFNDKYLTLIQKYFPDFNVEYKELSKRNYQITISSTKNIRSLVNFIYVLSIFYHCLTSFEGTFLHEDEMVRYCKILNNIKAPYFIRYVVKSRVIRSEKIFNKIKEELAGSENIKLVFGDTHIQRSNFIKQHVGKNEIIDIGCNNMRSYGIQLAKLLNKDDILYHAIDIDEDALAKAERKVTNNAIDNVVFYKSLNEFLDTDPSGKYDIILSEVFEHITLVQDTKIIKNILKKLKFDNFIITTPNKDFNQYYNFEDEDKRLDEHIFEMKKSEFQEYFIKLLKPYKVSYEFYDIGDVVDGITPTQAIIIRNNGKNND